MAELGNAAAAVKSTGKGSVTAKIQFVVIPQNGNVSLPVPTPTQTPR
jgi:hypothetical protein